MIHLGLSSLLAPTQRVWHLHNVQEHCNHGFQALPVLYSLPDHYLFCYCYDPIAHCGCFIPCQFLLEIFFAYVCLKLTLYGFSIERATNFGHFCTNLIFKIYIFLIIPKIGQFFELFSAKQTKQKGTFFSDLKFWLFHDFKNLISFLSRILHRNLQIHWDRVGIVKKFQSVSTYFFDRK